MKSTEADPSANRRVGMALDFAELTDEQLAAEAAREGSDGPAFLAIVGRYQERVWRVCFRLMGNAEDAHDATQEVFVRLFFGRAKYQGRSKYSTWVHGVAVRTCLAMRRSRTRRRRHEAAARRQPARSERRRSDGAELSLDLTAMLETLDEEDRALLIMKYAESHSYDELAELFHLSVSACKMRVSRARQKLRERFPEHDFGEKTS